jgi:hypothetical protein
MRRYVAIVLALSVIAGVADAQAPADTVAKLDTIVQRLKSLEALRIWPGFRPDTIPIAFVLPAHGSIVLNWPGAVPGGYQAIANVRNAIWRDHRDLGAASTGTSIAGRPVAQVVVSSLDPSVLLPTAIHEAFHVFQAASAKPGRRFGRQENAFYVSSYPVFDVENEMLFAREGELLLRALRAPTLPEKRELARQFVAVRRTRQRRLDDSFAQFERASEMNEGLAQYAQVRALYRMMRDSRLPPDWRSLAQKRLAEEIDRLADLTGNISQSFRLRFYSTGLAQATLLDSLWGSTDWKHEMMVRNETLQDALGRTSGLDAAEAKAFRLATLPADSIRISAAAQAAVTQLKALRAAQVDSFLSRPGVLLELSASELPSKDFGSCSFDPQNLLQVTTTMQLHTRTWRPCSGSALVAEFNVPAVHDRTAGMIRAVIGTDAEVKITAEGAALALADGQTIAAATDVKIEAPRVSVQSARANLSRSGRTVRITPLP